VLTPVDTGYVVYVPDLAINTEGKDLADAIYMARDAIGLWGITQQDFGRSIPEPSSNLPKVSGNEIVTLVDIDFDTYRRANDNRTVRKNLTIPSWLNERAEKAGVNFSQILQEGLKQYLGIKQP
jgi:predicted RNase H-like HicB family nuclease